MLDRPSNTEPARAPTGTDILIVGAGLAGLFLALKLAPRPCTIVSTAPIGTAASSAWAQGGIAAALDPMDTPAAHAADTVNAGAGLVDPVVAHLIAEEGAARVEDLLKLGVPFDRTPDGNLVLSLEAAHSRPRVARVAGDLAGKAIMDALATAVRNAEHITLLEGIRAVALLRDDAGRIAGVTGVQGGKGGERVTLTARETVLCTGGSGGLFRVTTNPRAARGDALAMAWTAGALVADTEFVQFHPTALDVGVDPAPLATEALRGEGARLVNADGSTFMTRYHQAGELAPRDEVARAIQAERLAGRDTFLDATEAVGAAFPEHFPTVFAACQAAGLDPRIEPIPVAPAAHYHMGGVVSDLWGRTTLEGLSVCGECASTGAHGANRLASNSLLEAVVFAERIARRLRDDQLEDPGQGTADDPPQLPAETLETLRHRMQDACGVVRTGDGLSDLIDWIDETVRVHGQASALVAARLIAEPALVRTHSVGGHFRQDYPQAPEVPERGFNRKSAIGPPRTQAGAHGMELDPANT
ncbi:MAG: L-aspartate oxidase [Pseudomonadota bacterium]